MGSVKAIAEYKNKENTMGVNDWNDAWNALMTEERIKEEAENLITPNVYESLSDIIAKVVSGDENVVFSPTALYLALIVLSGMTEGNTKKQIFNAIGLDEKCTVDIYNAIKDITEAMCGYANSTISSSIWLNESLNYNSNLLEMLKDNFQVSSYEGEMGSQEINESISKWINDSTGNLLSRDVKVETTPDMLFDFFTTIYFNSKWDYKFWDEDTRPGEFKLEDGKGVRCKYMRQFIKTQYHEGNNFTAMTKELKGGYDAIFVLPNEGVSVHSLVNDSQIMELASKCSIESTEKCDVTFKMPKFEISSKINLIDIMKKLGINDVFVPGVADFNPISNEDAIYLSKAEQTTRVKMDEQGVEAASCVEMGAVAAGIPPKYRKVKFELNRPFLFFVVSHQSLPLFAGKVMNPSDK